MDRQEKRGLYPSANRFPGGRERLHELIGKNVEIRATFRRHGYKADATDQTPKSALSPRGRLQIAELARKSAILKDGRFIRSSPAERAYEAADIIMMDAQSRGLVGGRGRTPDKPGRVRVRHELRMASSEVFDREWNRVFKENLPPNYSELSFEDQMEAATKAEDAAYEWWFAQGEHPDLEIPSVHEMATELAVLVSRVINTPDKLWNRSHIDEELVSHLSKIETILKEILVRKVKDPSTGEETRVTGFNSLADIGGGMRPGEGWTLMVKTDANRNKRVYIHLRGVDYDIDLQRLNELREEGIKSTRERRDRTSLVQIGEALKAQDEIRERVEGRRENTS